MDKIKVAVLALFTAALTTACHNEGPYARKIDQVDSLISVVDSFTAKFESMDPKAVSRLSTHVDSQYNTVLKKYPDSSDREFWVGTVGYFGHIQKALNRFEENEKDLREELAYSKAQLIDLKEDLKKKAIEPEVADQYLRDEAGAINLISLKMAKVVGDAERSFLLWDSLQPQYDSISNHLRAMP